MGHSKNSSKREIYIDTEKYQINNLVLHLKELEKEQTKPEIIRRKEMIKIRVEINEIETKEQ